jgi:hypothetical protein
VGKRTFLRIGLDLQIVIEVGNSKEIIGTVCERNSHTTHRLDFTLSNEDNDKKMKKRVRDIYGNWVWVDSDQNGLQGKASSNTDREPLGTEDKKDENLKLQWRDYIAITIASFETILLPVVIFIVILFILAVVLSHS